MRRPTSVRIDAHSWQRARLSLTLVLALHVADEAPTTFSAGTNRSQRRFRRGWAAFCSPGVQFPGVACRTHRDGATLRQPHTIATASPALRGHLGDHMGGNPHRQRTASSRGLACRGAADARHLDSFLANHYRVMAVYGGAASETCNVDHITREIVQRNPDNRFD